MGLPARIYTEAGKGYDCTNGGWSSRYLQVCIVNAEGPFEPDDEHPAVLVRKHRTVNALHVVSQEDLDNGKWTMFGGNFLYCSDSRFGELCRRILCDPDAYIGAVQIHDRIEQ